MGHIPNNAKPLLLVQQRLHYVDAVSEVNDDE